MRQFAIFLLIVLSSTYARSQSGESNSRVLTVEKARKNRSVIYVFKPDEKLRVKTTDKVYLEISTYLFLDNAIVLSPYDTIAFADIAWVKGKVFGNEGRKILGGFISFLSIPAAGMGGFMAEWALGIPGVIGGIPFAGSFVGGLFLMGPRKFDTTDKWTLVLRPE